MPNQQDAEVEGEINQQIPQNSKRDDIPRRLRR